MAEILTDRKARDGELCSCGRPARIVFESPEHGDIPWCGHTAGETTWDDETTRFALDRDIALGWARSYLAETWDDEGADFALSGVDRPPREIDEIVYHAQHEESNGYGPSGLITPDGFEIDVYCIDDPDEWLYLVVVRVNGKVGYAGRTEEARSETQGPDLVVELLEGLVSAANAIIEEAGL